MKAKRVICCFFLLISTLCSYAWGPNGHRTIARITYSHLTNKAKKQIDHILGKGGMIYWCNYADEIKSDTILSFTHTWHYQDLEPNLSDEELVKLLVDYPTHDGDLFRVLDELQDQLSKRANPCIVLGHELTSEQALILFIHLLGDWFCPMHIAHKDDHGGNRVKMKWFGQSTNLHRVWDENLIDSRGLSYTEHAEWLENRYSNTCDSLKKVSSQDMLRRCYALQEQIYQYQTAFDGNTYHYIYRFKDDLDQQLYHAGIHLANILNQIYH